MSFGERGEYRPSEELQEQLERAHTTLGNKPEHALTHSARLAVPARPKLLSEV